MNIVILDGYTLNPGDLDWRTLQQLGNVTIYDRSAPEEIIDRAQHAEIILVNKVILNANTLNQLPNLRYIGVMATGYNNVDIDTARKNNVIVTNVKGYGAASAAQHTFALILALTNHLELHSQSVFEGDWARSADFCYWKTPLIELAGKTIGLIGLGDIGGHVARIAQAFGMHVIAYRKHPQNTTDTTIEMTSLEDVFKRSDVLSLHCPLTEETKELINTERLSWMKNSAFVINTGRGPLINEGDLAEALNNKVIAGAGLDVLSTEPPASDNPLLTASNCIITPHIAWASFEARKRLLGMIENNIAAFQKGEPISVVS
jgi:glycerate dehydrogenase